MVDHLRPQHEKLSGLIVEAVEEERGAATARPRQGRRSSANAAPSRPLDPIAPSRLAPGAATAPAGLARLAEAQGPALAEFASTVLGTGADPVWRRPDQINHCDGGRGVYFADPDGHNLEVITRT